jgi:DNA topoisomerase-1
MPFDGSSSLPARLHYADDSAPGIRRRGGPAGVSYVGPGGRPIRDAATLERIRKLAIPPAYEDVWICPDPRGHIQATGRDARGRKQYRYHPDWRTARDETKYARMAAFGRALPAVRARVDADLQRPGLPREKVLAAVVRLLELTLIRVGNDEYSRTNKSFGLTTLRDRHVKFEGAQVRFTFRGKSGVQHQTSLRDRRLARIVRACQEIPGQRLFQYYDEAGEHRGIESADVNAYLREASGQDFTAKDFRTWAGTIAAAKALALQPAPETEREAKEATALCVKATAGLLGNTPAVCRKAYIHPEVLTAFAERRLPEAFRDAEGTDYEAAVLSFLDALAEAS